MEERAWRRVARRVLLGALLAGLGGCATEEVRVGKTVLSDQASFRWPFVSTGKPKTVFSTDDEQVSLWVHFDINFVGAYLVYDVEWIAPDGFVYLRDPLRPQFGTHQELIARLPVRGHEAANLPGRWKVRVSLLGRPLAEREFDLVMAEREALQAKSPEPALRCPPLGQPAGGCVDIAPQE